METQETLRQRRFAPKEVRRQQLIEATLVSLAENGISGTTMAAVTGRAGLSMGIVSLHFKSKDNLLTSTLRHLSEEIRDAWVNINLDATLSVTQRLSGVVAASFDPKIASITKIAVWFAFFGEAKYRQVYRVMVEEFDDERTDAIADLCAKIIKEGGYKNICPETLATTIECLCDGLWLNMVLYPEWMSPEAAMSQVMDLLARHFPDHFDLSLPATVKGVLK
jgi:TetR/AcrR family transcriptional repressor of bet genes